MKVVGKRQRSQRGLRAADGFLKLVGTLRKGGRSSRAACIAFARTRKRTLDAEDAQR